MARRRTERTVWEVRKYDVCGNETDGWVCNCAYVVNSHLILDLPVRLRKTGVPWGHVKSEYHRAEISERQIREALDCCGVQLNIDGDDVHVTASRRKDGYPIGELICVSHKFLDPIIPHEWESPPKAD